MTDANVIDLAEVIAGADPGRRTPEEIMPCSSQGMGVWDVAVAQYVYKLAKEKGIGEEFDFHPNVAGYAR